MAELPLNIDKIDLNAQNDRSDLCTANNNKYYIENESSSGATHKDSKKCSTEEEEMGTANNNKDYIEKESNSGAIPKHSKKCSTEEEEMGKFAQLNQIEYKPNQSQGYCLICMMTISNSLSHFRKHVNGVKHRRSVARQTLQSNSLKRIQPNPNYSTSKSKDFIKQITKCERKDKIDVIINESLCIESHSFVLCKQIMGLKFECQACDVTLDMDDVNRHSYSKIHKKAVSKIPIIDMEGEFIREIKQGMYHCGYCNLVLNGWDDMLHHLKCNLHEGMRLNAEWNMMVHHMPPLQKQERKEVLQKVKEAMKP